MPSAWLQRLALPLCVSHNGLFYTGHPHITQINHAPANRPPEDHCNIFHKRIEKTARGVRQRLGKLEIFHYRNIMTNTVGGQKWEVKERRRTRLDGKGKVKGN